MPLSSFSINPFVERKKARESTDELAAVKAAAWAWYHHGSGSEPKPMREFGLVRTSRAPQPSRYKLEAMRMAETLIEDRHQTPADHSLLDKFEIDSISRQLKGLLDPRRESRFSLKSFAGEMVRRRNKSSERDENMERKKTKDNNKKRGLWGRNLVICGKTEDVVDRSFVPCRPAAGKQSPAK